MCLLGATAFGAHVVFFKRAQSPVQPHQSRLVTVAHGHAGADRWTLRLYARGGQLCGELDVVAQQVSSRCSPPPGPAALEISSLASPTRGYVFGTTGAHVRSVIVRAGSASLKLPTHEVGGAGGAIGAPRSTRFFVAVLPRQIGQVQENALVTGFDSARRSLGRPLEACIGEGGQLSCPG